jgi:hypothetical protein
LLTMSVGQEPDPTHIIVPSDSNWVKAFLALPVIHDPGTKFLYNSMATFMLSAIVQKVTGEKVIDYLKPRLFDPLGIEGMDWEVSPRGINTGGWGLRLKTEDMARFGQLLLQKGKWNGKQIVPAEWIEEASSFKIDQAPGVDQAVKDSSDWMQGYCYQFWRCRNNGFRADGAYGQYIIVLPEKDAVIAITAESPDMQDEINLVWNYLLPAITDESLPENNEAYTALTQKLQTLALPIPAKSSSPLAESISGKTFILEPNDRKLEAITLNFTGEACDATLKIDHVEYDLLFGAGEWITGETSKPGPNLISLPGSLPTSKIACTYCWKDDQTVELILRYIESPHTEMVICKFNKNKVEVTTHLSIPPGYDLPVIIGTMEGE